MSADLLWRPTTNLLAGAGDALGLLFFVIVAILSALSKRKQARDAERTEAPPPSPRRAPSAREEDSMPHPAPMPAAPREAAPSLEEEMRRFVEQLRRAQEAPPPPQAQPAPLPRHLAPEPSRPPRKKARPVPPPMTDDAASSEGPRTPVLAEAAPDLRAEIGRGLEALHAEMQAPHTELREVAPPSAVESAPATAVSRFDFAAFRTPDSVRRAVLFSEILSPPRSLKPW